LWKLLLGGGAAFLAIVILFFPTQAKERLDLSQDTALQERVELLEIGARVARENPLGIGRRHFLLEAQDYSERSLKPWEVQPIHNVFVLQGVENGFFGLAAYIALWVFLVLGLWKKRKKFVAKILLASLVMIFVVNNVDHYFYTIFMGQAYWWMIVGLTGKLG
ncbi:MAG TPA: O-antigen ligase domain-containing protein, partial [Candidatus Peregrinibacteria bacterium]|nr:O-antigen ligase domain-containing protein [Candidatus Peregrinibacteria bacterium]